MLEQELHYLLMRAFHASNREVLAQVRETGLLPGQPKVLEYLDEHDGCTQKQLGEGCAPAGLARLSDRSGTQARGLCAAGICSSRRAGMGRHRAGGARGIFTDHAENYCKFAEEWWKQWEK